MHLHEIHKFWKNDHFNQADWDEKREVQPSVSLHPDFIQHLQKNQSWATFDLRKYKEPVQECLPGLQGKARPAATYTHTRASTLWSLYLCGSTVHLTTVGLCCRVPRRHSTYVLTLLTSTKANRKNKKPLCEGMTGGYATCQFIRCLHESCEWVHYLPREGIGLSAWIWTWK